MEAFTDLLALIASNVWIYGGSFLIVLGILVIVHEWGHYAAARACGVRVDEFAVGMGREIYGWTARSGTRWKICLLPIGGYVKMFGDSDPAGAGRTEQVLEPEGTPRPMTEDERKVAFFTQPVPARAFIVFAGPAVNFIFAVMLLAAIFVTQGREITPAIVSGLEVDGAGAQSGLIPGDRVQMIDGAPVQTFDDLRRKVTLALDTPMVMTIDRAGKVMKLKVTPKREQMEDRFGFKHQRGYLGVLGPSNGFDLSAIASVDGVQTQKNADRARDLVLARLGKGPFRIKVDSTPEMKEVLVNPVPAMNKDLKNAKGKNYKALILSQTDNREYIQYSLMGGLAEAVNQTYRITADSLLGLGQMISGVRSASELGGVIRIGTLAGDMAQAGMIAFVTFTALLSINLGLINLFPVPMLDGGHLLFYAIEAIRGRPIPDRFQEYAFRFGLVVLVFLMVFSNLNDILQLVL